MPHPWFQIEIHAPRWLHPLIMPLLWVVLHAVSLGRFCYRWAHWKLRRIVRSRFFK